jgi:zinc and cadmium transporter
MERCFETRIHNTMQATPHPELLHTLIALALVSVASVVGSVSFALGKRLQLVLPYLVSAAAGALLGTALYNLMPEALEHSASSKRTGLLLTFGFLLSFVLERLLGMLFRSDHHNENAAALATAVGQSSSIHHTHEHHHAGRKSLVTNVLLSGAVHSLVDGIGIALAFATSHAAGVATALAVLLHEVPHHIADVGVLIYSGLSKRRAILLNLLATTGCATGGVLVLLFGSLTSALTPVLLPLTAANFLYIAVGILMPELQREKNQRRSLVQMAVLVAAVLVVASLSHYFPESDNPSLAHLMK